MKNTEFMNLSLPEGADKIDIEILNNDFTAIENLLKQHAIVETMTLNGEGVIIGAIGPYIRLQNIDTAQVSIDIGKETFTLASGENVIIRETAENIGIITSGNVHITYFTDAKTYTDRNFYDKKKVDELLKNVEANVEVDAELSETSENPVQNKVITEQFSHYYTTTETDKKITEKVAEIVAGAPEDFDTLKEMSDWLKEHEDSAASMNSAIQKNTEDIVTANTAIAKNKTDIETANTNIQKNVNDITALRNDVAINKSTLGVQCKNLLPNNITSRNWNGVEVTKYDDGSFNLNGTMTATSTQFLQIGTVKANVISNQKIKISGINATYQIDLRDSDDKQLAAYTKNSDFELTINNNNLSFVRIMIQSASGTVYDNVTISPMIRYADITDDTYEPYVPLINEQISPIVKSVTELYNNCGTKNKIKIKSGVVKYGNFTITTNSDGTVKVSSGTTTTLINMTASENWRTLTRITIPAGNYYFESNAESGVSSDIRKADGTVICSNKNTCTITEETELYLNIRINANTTVSEEVILKPLFMLSYIKDRTYVPYIPTNAELREQINSLLARIEVLETATSTTEGGE